MNDRAPTKPQQEQKRARVRGTPKGRRVDPEARSEVQALLNGVPRQRNLLIEYRFAD